MSFVIGWSLVTVNAKTHSIMDDEVEIVGESSAHRAGPTLCQMCNSDLENLTAIQRQQHYDVHFNSSSSKQPSNSSKRPAISKHLFKPLRFQKQIQKSSDDFWYPAQSRPAPNNHSPGLITLLKHALKKSHAKGYTHRAVLCLEAATHIGSEAFDRGWGCGYRNFLMACAALMSQQIQSIYFALLDDPFPPSVRNLQRWLEAAWKEGYDLEGAKDLKNRLVGTSVWIGTGGTNSILIIRISTDFNMHFQNYIPRSLFVESRVQVMIDWIVDYFSPPSSIKQSTVTDVLRGASPVITTDKMPLILQYDGHSQTIIGYEVAKNGDKNLLIFDPSKHPKSSMRRAAIAGPSSFVWEQSRTNRVLQTVKHPTSNGLSSMRKRPPSPSDSGQNKRCKSSESDDEVIVVDGSDEPHKNGQRTSVSSGQLQTFTLDPTDVVNFFRLNVTKLKCVFFYLADHAISVTAVRRKQDYQILYFLMTDPWSVEERSKRKVVTSIRGC
ncbi:hypothetical protein AZE42_06955 [Rhizopogon vesiculosus]|uniref:UFSP1/2/DUB catalytic domain-containing protein n=1 Tax=Rhizopogon vesiculosus TaxID=180088 RepID=A0A1J8QID7_9AGAM|nr:hypothetical protein AZE42_06955 [Rhizopogon vesiculosus]